METDCVPTENGPSRFDWVWYLVWSNADASVIRVSPISLNYFTKSYSNLHRKIPTNLAPSYAQEINQPKA